MSIAWGWSQSARGTTVQVGLDVSQAEEDSQVTVTAVAYMRCTAGWVSDSYNTVVFSGRVNDTIRNANINLRAGQQIELGRQSWVDERSSDSRPETINVRVDGFTVGAPSASVTYYVPALSAPAPEPYPDPGPDPYYPGLYAPEKPLLLVTRDSDSRMNLSWSVWTTHETSTITSFEIRRQDDGGVWRTVLNPYGLMSSWVDTSVSVGHYYSYSIRSIGSGGESDWSTFGPIYTTPLPPSDIVASRDGADIILRWVNNGVGEYRTSIWKGDTTDSSARLVEDLLPGVTSYRIVGASPLESHMFTVGHQTPNGLSVTATSNTIRLASAPLAPTVLAPSGVPKPAGGEVTFVWRHNPMDSSSQTKYELRYRTQSRGQWITVTGTASQSHKATLSSSASVCEWQVRTWGQDEDKPSDWSVVAQFELVDPPSATFLAPSPGGTVTSDATEVRFRSSNYPAFYELRVSYPGYYCTFTGNDDKDFSVPLSNLPNGVTVTLRLTVTDKVTSPVVTQTFQVKYASPPAPTADTYWDPKSGVVTLTIKAPSGSATTEIVDHVRVERSIDAGPWELVDERAYNGATLTDSSAGGANKNTYRLTAVSSQGTSVTGIVVVDTRPRPLAGFSFSMGTSGMPLVLRWNPDIVFRPSLADKKLHRMAGRVLPVVFAGVQVERLLTVTTVVPFDESSVIGDVERLSLEARPILYRDPTGRRFWCTLTGVSIESSRRARTYSVSMTVVEVDR